MSWSWCTGRAAVVSSRRRSRAAKSAAACAEDRFVLKVAARSMRHLEEVTGRIAGLGSVTTSVVYSSPPPDRPITAPAD